MSGSVPILEANLPRHYCLLSVLDIISNTSQKKMSSHYFFTQNYWKKIIKEIFVFLVVCASFSIFWLIPKCSWQNQNAECSWETNIEVGISVCRAWRPGQYRLFTVRRNVRLVLRVTGIIAFAKLDNFLIKHIWLLIVIFCGVLLCCWSSKEKDLVTHHQLTQKTFVPKDNSYHNIVPTLEGNTILIRQVR